jgi:FtsH ternary system-associated peptide
MRTDEPDPSGRPRGADRRTAARAADGPPADHVFVDDLPDLIDPSEYADHPRGGLVRLRVVVTETGVEIQGDAMRPQSVEALLAALGGGAVEQMLCG